MSEKSRCRVHIRGRVQGVAFRWETRRAAERLGVCGWVRNRSDGSVEGLFEGSGQAVEGLVAWCRQGPVLAAVTGVDVEKESYRGEFDRFFIHS